MNGALSALAIGSLVFVLVPIGFLFVRVAGGAFKNRRWTKIDRGILTAGILLLSILFLRPHQHVYQALDSSAFRHMARAFEAGRGLQDPDPAFAYLPREIRPWVMLDPFCFEHGERPTRDRSFQLDGLDDAGTRPFFYPMLSLNMAALSELSRGRLRDYFIPLLSLLFWIAMSIVAGGRAGWRGILFTLALVVASPLPVWLGRGCYLESVSAVLLGLAILSWISLDADESPPVAAFWAVGLAVTYHPIMILPALPLGVALLFSCRHRRAGWAGVGFGILGIAPLFAMTEWICAPYGALRAGSLKAAILHNAYIRPAFVLVVLLAVGLLSVLFWIRSGRWNPRIPRIDWGRAAGLCALWALPTLSALLLPDRMGLTQTVKQGASDALSGMQLPLLVFMLGLSALVARLPGLGRERWLMSVTAMVLPIFLHLKGLEMMGLWSQRRLLAPWILLLTITLSAGTALMAVARSRMGPMKRLADGVLIAALIAGLHNPIRWPAPYRVRYEAGADAFVEELERELQSALVFFDYHTHSLPLTVMPEGRVYGLSEQAAPGLPPVSAWLRERAEAEPVFWVTAYRNPGIEDGVRLVSQGRHKVRLPRVRAGKALPAVQEDISISLEILRVEPLRPGDPAVLDKVFELRNRKGPDGPQLGVRGPWGRSDIPLTGPDGSALPAQWTRSGSAVVGPVPLPGGSVRLVLEAAAARRDGRTNQTVRIVPPWGGPGLDLSIDQRYTRVEGILVRPEFDPELGSQTGLYRIDVQWPYDPSDAGISGFDRDLGVLLHRIRIERTAGLIPLHTGQAESGGE